MNLPKQYLIVLNRFLKSIHNQINELELLAITGSGGRGKIISGWSDLDLLLVYRNLGEKDILDIYRFAQNQPIKIGITIYSKEEFESGLVDSKTTWNIKIIKEKIIHPLILKKSLSFPQFNLNYLINLHRALIPEKIHKIKRNLALNSNFDLRELAKDVDTLMKFAIFSMTGQIVSGYKEVQCVFYNLFPESPSVANVFNLMDNPDRRNYYSQVWNFIKYFTQREIINEYRYAEAFSI